MFPTTNKQNDIISALSGVTVVCFNMKTMNKTHPGMKKLRSVNHGISAEEGIRSDINLPFLECNTGSSSSG